MATQKYLIVNADDFGLSPGINQGIIESHERGIVTSASLMVRWRAAAEAAAYAREHRSMGLGLHVDLGEWMCRNTEWVAIYEVVPRDDSSALKDEIAGQFETFTTLSGVVPTHIDSHQHVHRSDPLRSILAGYAEALGIPLRLCNPSIIYCGGFYGQTEQGVSLAQSTTVEGLLRILASLPSGITELSCHPAGTTDFEGAYRDERLSELKTLCDPRVRKALDTMGIRLCSFHDVARQLPTS